MPDDAAATNTIDEIVESYIDRQRRGERPSITEYLERYPWAAEEIRSILPMVELLEELGSEAEPPLAAAESSPTTVPGQLGEFRILREIGRGGMGVVYEAIQETLDRRVALKVLPARIGRSQVLEARFRREAQAAAGLHHSNIIPLFSVGEAEGVLYYAMQFIQGKPLDAVLTEIRQLRSSRSGDAVVGDRTVAFSEASHALLNESYGGKTSDRSVSPPPNPSSGPAASTSLDLTSPAGLSQYFRNVAQVGIQVASALEYAHSRGIVHRDIKPANLMLDAQGVVWVMDFGLAKAEGAEDLTHSGDVLGTVRYMGPEQFAGQADARTDVYALGLTLYEMVTLRPAFNEVLRHQLIDKIQRKDPPRPTLLEPRIPRDLETILLRATAKDPRDRYSSARLLQDDLAAFLSDRPIAARRMSYWEQGTRWCRRNRAFASLVGLVVSLLIIAVIASSWTAAVLRQERNAANQARDTARRELWLSKVNEARAIAVSREPDRRSRALRLVREALSIASPQQISVLELAQIRSVAASALLLPEVTEVRCWRPRGGQPDSWSQTVDFDDALETFAVRLKGGWVSLRRAADDTEILQSPSLNRNPVVNLSASGKFLAITDRVPAFERLEIWNVRTRPASLVYRSMGSFGKFVVFAKDDTHAAYFRRNAGLEIVDLETKTVTTISTPSKDPWRPLALDNAGTRLAYPDEAVSPSVVRIHDVRLNKELATIRIGDHVDGIAWHPSGETLAIGRADETIWLVDVSTRQVITSYSGHTARGISLSFNHRGDRMLSNDWENRLRMWDVGSRQEILSFPCRGRMFRVHPQDELLATEGETADDSLRILRLNPGRALRTLQQSGGRRLRWDATLVGGVHPVAWGTTIDSLPSQRGLAAASLETGDVISVAVHPSDRVAAVLDDGSVVSFGRRGIARWRNLPTKKPGEITFGTPVIMHPRPTERRPGISGNGLVMAIPCEAEGALLVREGSEDRMVREGLADIRSVAVNADGTLIALANFNKPVGGGNIRIVDVTTSRVVASLEAPLNSYVSFSPDGRWLMAQMVTSISNCRIWRVGQWSTPLDVDGLAVTVNATGTLAASSDSRGNVRIFRLKDGSDVVRLALPGEESLFVRGFSQDGSILLVGSAKYEAARLIDLRMIREELSSLGLDWEDPILSSLPSAEIHVRWGVDPAP